MKAQDLQNYATQSNGCKILEATSQNINGQASNVLRQLRKKLWVTVGPPPQSLLLDLTNLSSKPQNSFNVFGIDCWYDYTTNPKQIQISMSHDGKQFEPVGKFRCEKREGWQLFDMQDIPSSIKYLQLTILSNFGDQTTYLNQIMLSCFASDMSEIDRYLPTKEKEVMGEKSSPKYVSTEKEIKRLRERVNILETKNERLEASNKQLSKKVAQMEQKIHYLMQEVMPAQKKQKPVNQQSQNNESEAESSQNSLQKKPKPKSNHKKYINDHKNPPKAKLLESKSKQKINHLPPAPKMNSNKHQSYKNSLNNTPSSSSQLSHYQMNSHSAEKKKPVEKTKQKESRIEELKRKLEEKKREKKSVEMKLELSNERKRAPSDYANY